MGCRRLALESFGDGAELTLRFFGNQYLISMEIATSVENSSCRYR